MVGCRDLCQRLRAADRERSDARDRVLLIVRQVDKSEGKVREARDR